MRTTLTLDTDVADLLGTEMRRSGRGMRAVVNDALRVALAAAAKPVAIPQFRVEPHSFGIKPGIDLDRINQLVDELEAQELASRLGRRFCPTPTSG